MPRCDLRKWIVQAVNTVVAGVLHDVLDDTSRKKEDLQRHFGEEVAGLVAGVSRLSHINQVKPCSLVLASVSV